MKTRSNTYYIVRSIVRFTVGILLAAAVMVGIPLAVDMVWPALIVSAVLWVIVLFPFIREFHQRGMERRVANAG